MEAQQNSPEEPGTVEEITGFWRHVFAEERGLLQVWTGKRVNGEIPEGTAVYNNFPYPKAAQDAAQWALKKAGEGREVYFCVHLLSRPRRVKGNAAPVRTLWGDLDGAPLPNSGLKPTAVVESSPGRFHVYWRLDSEIPPEPAEQLNRRIAAKIGADPSGFDLSQLLRVPGTTNHKREEPAPVRLAELNAEHSYNAAELDEALPKSPERAQESETDGEPRLEEPPVRLPRWALRFWRGEDYARTADGALDRSRSLYKIGAILRECGASRRVIVDALAERDASLGWRKFTAREDRGLRYAEIADRLAQGESASPTPPVEAEVVGAELLEELTEFIRRFVILREEQARLTALWVVHTHAFDAADTTPYLHIKSAEKRSGKSRLLEVLELLADSAWYTGRVTPAVLIRKIAAETPTLLLDESDAAFKASQEYTETLRGVLNAGFRRGGVASLCVGQGANIDYRDFPVYSPKAIAGIGRLPDTVADRSIPIDLKRKTKGEAVARFRRRKVEAKAQPLRDKAAAWVESVGLEALAGREAELPTALDDRAQDIIEPLLAIADAAGGEWPRAARDAAVKLLSGEEREDQDSLGVQLLTDIKAVFEDEEGTDRLSTAQLLAQLNEMDESPWGDYKGKALDSRRLANLLKPYGVKSDKIRIEDKTPRGYLRASFEDAWARYLPDPAEESEGEGETNPKGSNPPVCPPLSGTVEHSDTYQENSVPHRNSVPEQNNHVERHNADAYADVPHVPHTGGNTEETPLSSDLEPGESATLEELRERRDQGGGAWEGEY
jgi:Protein of unknown function (DUF3631)/RepB DNA-primase N-terminal domain